MSKVAASNSPVIVIFLPPVMSLLASVIIALLAITVPFVIPSIRLMSVALAVTPSKMFNSATVDVIPSRTFISDAVAVTPSSMLSSAVVDVTPSSKFNSAVVLVTPSRIFSSAVVEVTPSRILSSAAVDVTPSNMFSSAAVDVITVPLKFIASKWAVPSIYKSLNSSELVPKSISLSVIGTIAPSCILNCCTELLDTST